MEDLLTVAEIARLKGVSRSAVYKAIVRSRLKSRRVLGKTVSSKEDVAAWRPFQSTGRRKGTPMSEDAKARISAAQKQRWVRRKDAQQ